MNCLQFRKQLLSAPRSLTTELLAHRGECAQCAAFTSRVERQEAMLTEAVLVDLPEGLANRILLRRSLADAAPLPGRRRLLALAASIAVATTGLGAFLFWRDAQEDLLESAVTRSLVAHLLMAHPPGLGAVANEVAATEVSGLLKRAGFAARTSLGRVTNGWPCVFGDQPIAHLVLASGAESVTALVLPFTLTRRVHRFVGLEVGGIIAPCVHGTVALLVQSEAEQKTSHANLDAIVARLQDTLVSA